MTECADNFKKKEKRIRSQTWLLFPKVFLINYLDCGRSSGLSCFWKPSHLPSTRKTVTKVLSETINGLTAPEFWWTDPPNHRIPYYRGLAEAKLSNQQSLYKYNRFLARMQNWVINTLHKSCVLCLYLKDLSLLIIIIYHNISRSRIILKAYPFIRSKKPKGLKINRQLLSWLLDGTR